MKFQNPVIKNDPSRICLTADPHVNLFGGVYHHCYEANGSLFVATFPTLSDFNSEKRTEHRVYTQKDVVQCFAPELHLIDDEYYIYGAPCPKDSDIHFVCVYKSKDKTPTGEFELLGEVEGIGKAWSIDATVFEYLGNRYMIYTTCKTIYISKMKSPTALECAPVAITSPELTWETTVTEGPAVIFDGDTPVLIYSANDSACDDYCLGMMRLSGNDPLAPGAWKKHKEPILTKNIGMYGPGHCSFTEEDGELYCIYHANLESGTGWNGRSIFIKRAYFEDKILKFD